VPDEATKGRHEAAAVGIVLALAQAFTQRPGNALDASGFEPSAFTVLVLLLTAVLTTLVLHGVRRARAALAWLSILLTVTLLADAAALGALAATALSVEGASCGTWCSPVILASLHAMAGVACGACALLLFRSRTLRAIPRSTFGAPEIRRDLSRRAAIVLLGALPASVLASAVVYSAADTARLSGRLAPLWVPVVVAGILGMAGLWMAALGAWRRVVPWFVAAGVLADAFAVFIGFADAPLRTLRRFLLEDPGDLLMLLILIAPLVIGIALLAGRLRTSDR
jgi:hypothetical protein